MMDLLLICGVIFAPMTALRVFKFGPGECLLIIWMLLVLFVNIRKRGYLRISINTIGKYQLANLFMMLVGMFVSMLLYTQYVDFGEITDLISHFFMFLLTSSLITFFNQRPVEEINSILFKIFAWGSIVYGALLFYATFISSSLFGIPLWMGGGSRFLGLAGNPHQIGMITGPGLFFSFYIMSISEKKKIIFRQIIIACLWFWVSLSLKSDTMTLCYVGCFLLWLFVKSSKTQNDLTIRKRNYIVITIFFVIVAILSLPVTVNALINFITEAGNGLGRIELAVTSLGQFLDKPVGFLTGLGPGSHTGMYMQSGNEMEAHNTYVQLILNSGIFICIYYIITVLGIINNPWHKNTYLVLVVAYFLLYGCGGNMNRRALVWFTYTMCWILFKKTVGTEASLK